MSGTGLGAATTSLAAAVAARPPGHGRERGRPAVAAAMASAPPPAAGASPSIAGWQALAAELMGGEGDEAAAAAAVALAPPSPPPPRPHTTRAPPSSSSLFAPGGLFFLQYEALKPLGRGAFGAAVLVRRRADGARLVAKVVGGGSGGTSGGGASGGGPPAEADALARLSHPHIVRYVAAFALNEAAGASDTPAAAILTEFCAGGDLASALAARRGRPLPPPGALAVAAQLARALAHCHARGTAHRDLKPANVLLARRTPQGEGGGGGGDGAEGWQVKLGDFGLASSSSSSSSASSSGPAVAGTPGYLAPEVVAGTPGAAGSPPADVWALGCVLFECLSGGRPAFGGGGGVGGVGAAILSGRRPPLPPPVGRLGAAAHALVDRLLAPRVGDRPSAASVLAFPAVAAAAAALQERGKQRAAAAAAAAAAV